MSFLTFHIQDSTLEFEKRRNVPVRYNREMVAQTIRAMDRIAEIRKRREAAFYKARMARARARENGGQASTSRQAQRNRDQAELTRAQHLAPAIKAEKAAQQDEASRRERIRVRVLERRKAAQKARSALVPAQGSSM